jgi:hypothetical protein
VRPLIVGFTALLLLAAAFSPAGASREPHDMTGRWLGAFQTNNDPNLPGRVELSLISQDKGTFVGTFVFPSGPQWPPDPCMVKGEVSDSLKVNAKGDCGPKTHFELHGQATEMNEHGIIPCIFVGFWKLDGPDSPKMTGDLALLHLQGGPVGLAEGHWGGEVRFVDDPDFTPVMAGLMQDRTGREGEGWFEVGDSFFDITYDVAEHPNSDTHGFSVVGGGEAGIIIINGRFVHPPDPGTPSMIDGHITLLMRGGDMLEGDISTGPVPPSGNNPPRLQGVSDRSVPAGETAAIDMQCFDPDGTTTSIQNTSAGPNSSFNQTSGNPGSGRYRQVTTVSQVGQVFNVAFVCTDSSNPPASDTEVARITVLSPTTKPPKADRD